MPFRAVSDHIALTLDHSWKPILSAITRSGSRRANLLRFAPLRFDLAWSDDKSCSPRLLCLEGPERRASTAPSGAARSEGVGSPIRHSEKRRHWQSHEVRRARASTAPSGAARSEGVGGPTRRSRCWRLKTDTSIISFCLSFCLYTPPPGPHDTALIKLSTTVQSYLCS